MAPTIKPGERITIDFGPYSPRRWDVVAMELPGTTNGIVLKRVIAQPGETISLTRAGIVVNGTPLNMPASLSNVTYCPPENLRSSGPGDLVIFPYVVGPKHYFVVGDNWTNSLDSRYYGAIPVESIVGRVRHK